MPTPAPRKKLIEVALPLEAINKESSREKSIRHGHPSTLHLWWARRPLAACRAVLFSSLVDDPEFAPEYKGNLEGAYARRAELFSLIEDLVKWENSNNPAVLGRARAEIAASVAARKIELGELAKETLVAGAKKGQKAKGALDGSAAAPTAWQVFLRKADKEVVNAFLAEFAPPSLDPFAGGGSIPLEAQRLGLRSHASDLNPVPVLINKALIEIPPKFAGKDPVNPEAKKSANKLKQWQGAAGLADDVRHYGAWMREQAQKKIGDLYPKVKVTAEMAKDRPDLKAYAGQELTVIAWLWARTVPTPNPAMNGAKVPLVSSFWLSKKAGKEAFVWPVKDEAAQDGWRFEVKTGKPGAEEVKTVNDGTIGRKGGTCILSSSPMPLPYVRKEGQGGRMGVRLMSIVAEGTRGRVYLDPNLGHVEAASKASPTWRPNAELPRNPRDFKTPNYGINTFGDLFTPRQLTALTTFSDLVPQAIAKAQADAVASAAFPADERALAEGGCGARAYGESVGVYLGFGISKIADRQTTLCGWDNGYTKIRNTFGRQALPMCWDFAEGNIFSDSTGNWTDSIEWPIKVLEVWAESSFGSVLQRDATAPYDQTLLISTDPPYYDNIGYADLSDFFYVWLRRSLGSVYPNLLATLLTPKTTELIATPYRHEGSKEKAARFFEEGLGRAIGRMREAGHPDYPVTIFYAFKQQEDDGDDEEGGEVAQASTGWETFLSGVMDKGFQITATWPMRTELANRMVGSGTNALASSIVLACRPRPADAPNATLKQYLDLLRAELPTAIKDLQLGSVAPVDLAQAAIGPGIGVFSRFARVLTAEGRPMTVREALQRINQVLDEVLAAQEGELDSDSRFALKWFEQRGFEAGPYGEAETLATAMAVSVSGLVEAGIAESRQGKVRLLKMDELPKDWDPQSDQRLTRWESVHHLAQALATGGESAAADLLRKLHTVGGDLGDSVRDLAYRLYNLCEKKKWSAQALPYNALVASWPEVDRMSRQAPTVATGDTGSLF